MRITRRQFIGYVSAAGASLGLSELQVFKLTEALAKNASSTPKLVWLQGQACNGCTVATAQLFHDVSPEEARNYAYSLGVSSATGNVLGNGASGTIGNAYGSGVENFLDGQSGFQADIADVLLDVIDLNYHQTLSGPAGYLAMKTIQEATGAPGGLIVAVEGAIPEDLSYSVGRDACGIGTASGAAASTLGAMIDYLAPNTAAFIAVGQCSSFGNWPASKNQKWSEYEKKHSDYYPNGTTAHYQSTGALSLRQFLDANGQSAKPVIRLPGCPMRAEELYLTVAAALLNVAAGNLVGWYTSTDFDVLKRPQSVLGIGLYNKVLHNRCINKQDFLNGRFTTQWGQHVAGSQNGGCLAKMGCKGPSSWRSCQRVPTSSPTPAQAKGTWECLNGLTGLPVTTGNAANFPGTSCITAGAGCMACGEPGYPDRFSHPLVAYTGYSTTY